MTDVFRLGRTVDGHAVAVDPHELVRSRLLVYAMSGMGKSGVVRVMLESWPKAMGFLIVDPQGEWVTLRERHALLWLGAGDDHDAQLTAANAAAVGRVLREQHARAVIDLSEHADPAERQAIAADLLNAYQAPRAKPATLVVVDEAPQLAPQADAKSPSRAAIENIAQTGRKRRVGLAVMTPSLQDLSNLVSQQLLNRLVGRVAPDDLTRGARAAGVTGKARDALLHLPRRTMVAYGIAMTADGDELAGSVRFAVADAATRVELGDADDVPPAPTGSAMKALRQALATPPEAPPEESPASTAGKADRAAPTHRPDPAALEAARVEGYQQGREEAAREAALELEVIQGHADDRLATAIEGIAHFRQTLRDRADRYGVRPQLSSGSPAPRPDRPIPSPADKPAAKPSNPPRRVVAAVAEDLEPRHRKLLNAVARLEVERVQAPSRKLVAVVAGVSFKSSGFDKTMGNLSVRGLIEYPTLGAVALTDAGWSVAQAGEVLTRDALVALWRANPVLQPRHTLFLDPVIDAYPDDLSVEALCEHIGRSVTSSGTDKTLGNLSAMGLIERPRAGHVRATPLIFPEALS
ncbi:MAG: DUF87 domain-containing protein [Planctomycetota bacterium]